jgi:hypothetical protein
VLNKAADLIELRGWHQGDFYEEISGRICTAGAIRVAAGGVPYESCEQASSAEQAFANCLAAHGLAKPGHCPIEVIGQWNDAEGRTAAEVVATLRAAAGEVACIWATRAMTVGTRGGTPPISAMDGFRSALPAAARWCAVSFPGR